MNIWPVIWPIYGQLILTKEPRIYNEEIVFSSINGIGKTGQPHAKSQNWTII